MGNVSLGARAQSFLLLPILFSTSHSIAMYGFPCHCVGRQAPSRAPRRSSRHRFRFVREAAMYKAKCVLFFVLFHCNNDRLSMCFLLIVLIICSVHTHGNYLTHASLLSDCFLVTTVPYSYSARENDWERSGEIGGRWFIGRYFPIDNPCKLERKNLFLIQSFVICINTMLSRVGFLFPVDRFDWWKNRYACVQSVSLILLIDWLLIYDLIGYILLLFNSVVFCVSMEIFRMVGEHWMTFACVFFVCGINDTLPNWREIHASVVGAYFRRCYGKCYFRGNKNNFELYIFEKEYFGYRKQQMSFVRK